MSLFARAKDQFSGESVRARSLRSTGFTLIQIGGANVVRLLSNLVLTRLLFPEAFGLMALIQVFMYGLETFSDVGINTMLIQHKRGADRDFLDVLWTIQVIRGVILWIGACLIALPVAQIYEQPELLYMLPVVGFSMVINGFKTTKEIVANRELKLERVVLLQLASQVVELSITIALALMMQNVWALVIGLLISSAIRVIVLNRFLPGESDRFAWDPEIVKETLRFGSYIFLSTIAAFFVNMGNRMVLGAYVDLATFGIFNIGVMLANTASQLTQKVARTVIFPLYRIRPPKESEKNRQSLFKARRMVAVMQFAIMGTLALLGIWIVDFLYDTRYTLAGPVVTLLAVRMMITGSLVGTQEALIGSGDSKRFFFLMAAVATLTMIILFWGVPRYGIVAAIAAPIIGAIFSYPLRAYFTAKHNAWDPIGEIGLMVLSTALAGLFIWYKWADLSILFEF